MSRMNLRATAACPIFRESTAWRCVSDDGGDEGDQAVEIAHEFLVACRDVRDLGVRTLAVEGEFHVGSQVLARHRVDAFFDEHVEYGFGQGQGVSVEPEKHEVAGFKGFRPGGGKPPPKGLRVFFQFVGGEHMGTSIGFGFDFASAG